MNFHLNVMNLAIYFKTPFSPSVDRILRDCRMYWTDVHIPNRQIKIPGNDDVIWLKALI